MKVLYEFKVDCYYGELTGLFIADSKEVEEIIGKEVHFGEVMGKHSEVSVEIEEKHIIPRSYADCLLSMLEGTFGCGTIIGYNPLEPQYREE